MRLGREEKHKTLSDLTDAEVFIDKRYSKE